MDELNKKLEGEQTDNLEGTSPSSPEGVELNNSPVPTAEEIQEANSISPDGGSAASKDIGSGESNTVSSGDASVGTENVESGASEGNPGQVVDETAKVEETSIAEEQPPVAEKTFTQSQVNDLVGKTRMETREQTYRAVYGRYGVEDEAGMDELVGNAQRYETVRGEFDEAQKGWKASEEGYKKDLSEVKEHVALLESGIDRNRFDDAKAIMKAKGLEITVENIQNELATHPEWKGAKVEEPNPNFRPDPQGQPQPITPAPESTIKVLGNESDSGSGGMSEEEYAMKHLFKL